jgi:hypothetical protein
MPDFIRISIPENCPCQGCQKLGPHNVRNLNNLFVPAHYFGDKYYLVRTKDLLAALAKNHFPNGKPDKIYRYWADELGERPGMIFHESEIDPPRSSSF